MTYSSINLTEGSGPKASKTDVVGGVDIQIVKPVVGEEGEATPISSATPLPTQDGGAVSLLLRILNALMSPMGFDRSLSRQRVTGIIESGTVTTVSTVSTVTTVTTATTVGTVTNIGTGRTGIELQDAANRFAWAQLVRARIT